MGEDGRLDVLERIRFRFDGAFSGVYRTIPVQYRTPWGADYRLYIDVERISDESGAELRWEESREGRHRRLQVWVPGARDASRTVSIRYSVVGGLRFFDEEEAEGFADAHDELYWNVTGSEWEVPIHSASARVELPPGAEGARATAYTGSLGSTEQEVDVSEIEQGFYFSTLRTLRPREGLTVVVGWAPGVVRRPGVLTRAAILFRANWVLLLPFLVLMGMAWLWHTRGRDPGLRAIPPWYEPPDGLTPAEAGTLVDERPDTRDVTATLVDLAVRGYVKIEEVEKNAVHEFFTGADYRFHRVRDPGEWGALHEHERSLLEGLFGVGGSTATVELSELKNEFYKHLGAIKEGIFRRLMELGCYQKRPDRVRKLYLTAGAVILVVGFALAQAGALFGGMSSVVLAIAVVGSALPVMGFGYLMPARTRKGTRKLEQVRGFQEFLDRVEEDRFKRMITSPEQFERYLPYAMALGVDATWARAFREIVTEPPDWYVGHSFGGFRTTTFTRSLEGMSARTGTILASAPRGSGGSGFGGGGGGGFSGGGFGGGGGGAF